MFVDRFLFVKLYRYRCDALAEIRCNCRVFSWPVRRYLYNCSCLAIYFVEHVGAEDVLISL